MDKSFEEHLMEDIIRHIYSNRHLSNLGYDTMSMQMKNLFNSLVCKAIGDRNV